MIVGCSISFFLIISALELVQAMTTSFVIIKYQLIQCVEHIIDYFKGVKKAAKTKHESMTAIRQVVYESQLIFTNLQMFLVMITIFLFGIGLGYI
jgi:hypothetical protein